MVRHSPPHSLGAAAKAFCWRSERDSFRTAQVGIRPVRYRGDLAEVADTRRRCSPTRSKKAKLMKSRRVSVACSVIGWSVALPRISSNT